MEVENYNPICSPPYKLNKSCCQESKSKQKTSLISTLEKLDNIEAILFD